MQSPAVQVSCKLVSQLGELSLLSQLSHLALSSCHTQDHLRAEESAPLQLAWAAHADHPLESHQRNLHLSCRLLGPQEWALEGQARLEEVPAGLEAWL